MPADTRLLAQVVENAWQLARLLNTVEDDDERDLLREKHETVVNDELYSGSLNRQAARRLAEGDRRLAAVLGLRSDPRQGQWW